jgi:signal transduction histidine kinase
MARQVAVEHGGNVKAVATGGAGASFRVEIPVAPESSESTSNG